MARAIGVFDSRRFRVAHSFHGSFLHECTVVWGLGSGLHLLELVRDGGRVVLFAIDAAPHEPDHQARVASILRRHPDLEYALAESRIEIVGGTLRELATRFRELADGGGGGRPKLYVHRPALHHVPPAMISLARTIERIHGEHRMSTRIQMRMRSNVRRNIPALARAIDVAEFGRSRQAYPGFVLAAGPSLTPMLDALGPLHAHGRIIAVDTAIGPCQRRDIALDLVCTVDPHPSSAAHLAPLSPEAREAIVLAFQPYAWPDVVAAFPRRCAALVEHDRFCAAAQAITGLPLLAAGGTVLLFALQCAALMHCDPIILIGADFAHVHQRSHAEDTAHARIEPDIGVYVQNRAGEGVPTTSNLLGFKAAVELQIAALLRESPRPRQIWALDGGGACIDYARGLSVEEMLAWLHTRAPAPPPRLCAEFDAWVAATREAPAAAGADPGGEVQDRLRAALDDLEAG